MADLLLQHHQSIIHELRKTKPLPYFKEFLDKIVEFLNNTANNQSDGFHILTVICEDLAGLSNSKVFNNSEIRNHEFFVIVSNTFKMLFTKLTFMSLTKQDKQCLDGISLLISNLCLKNNQISTCFYTNNNEKLDPKNKEKFSILSYEKIFFTEIFIKKFIRILENDIIINDYDSWDIKYKILDRLIRLFIKLNDIDHKLILDAVIKCVESTIYINCYKTIDLYQPKLNPKQSFFIYQCPKFIRLCSYKRQDEISAKLSKSIVKFSANVFEIHLPVALEGEFVPVETKSKTREDSIEALKKKDNGAKNQAIAWFIEFLNYIALTPSTRVSFIETKHSNKTIVDQMIEILATESLIKSISRNAELFHADVALMSYAVTLLYNLTFEKKIFFNLKNEKVINICKDLFTAKDKTIQFAARTLAAILNKEDIDEIDSPTKVARSYLYFIENTIDDITLTYHGIKLDGILTNLEAIVQNDEIKEEITNDEEGIPLISRCAYEPHLDVETIKEPALRIIDAISFVNDSAIEQIKETDLLMEYIKTLTNNKGKPDPVANRILWKVEQEPELLSKQVKQIKRIRVQPKQVFDEKKAIYQYVRGDHRFHLTDQPTIQIFDIIISYCFDDKKFPNEIYNRLTASNFYKVSFDEDNKHSLNPSEMAQDIEKSAIVIMCFSSKYRNSYACRLEAEYAKKLDRPIIPVKIDYEYNPTGWLEGVIGDKKIIDFTKEFNSAYAQLIEEINETNEKLYID